MSWIVFFFILPHLKPASLEYLWPVADIAFDTGRVISALLIIFLFVLKKKLPSKPVWILAALQGWELLSTILNSGTIWTAIQNMASIISVALIVDFFNEKSIDFLSGLMLPFELMLYANFISVLTFYPNGLYISEVDYSRCYFLGYHNSFILYFLPAVVIALLYFLLTKKIIRPALVISAGVCSICITWSATSICGLLAFATVFLLSRTALKRWITYYSVFCATIVANLLISLFRVMDRVLWMADLIEIFLKKQITLTGRTLVWDTFYPLFFRSPILGYGTGLNIKVGNGAYVPHMHNQWFQFLFEGGIPALIFFLVLAYIVGEQVTKCKNRSVTNIFLSAFSALYILFIAEAYVNLTLYMLFMLAYHISSFESALFQPRKYAHLHKRGYHVPN